MLTQIKNRFRRAPLMALCVVLLAAVLTAGLCGLEPLAMLQEQNYQQLCASVPIQLTVTNLSGTRSDDLDAPSWVVNAFTSEHTKNGLYEYVHNVQLKARQDAQLCSIGGKEVGSTTLVGISGLNVSPELAQGNGALINWFPGFSEKSLATRQLCCLIPEKLLPEDYDASAPLEVTMHFSFAYPYQPAFEAIMTFVVAGTHKVGTDNIYCPYAILEAIYNDLHKTAQIDAVCATLKDNSQLELVREISKNWFAEPNPIGEKTPWDYSYYFYYPYALRIDDSQLVTAERNLKVNLLLNEICSYLLVALSAAAGFFIGFLMIRQRKREIGLMRTLGTPEFSVYAGFVLEQMLCVLLGAALGGVAFSWQPVNRVLIFLGIYFVGLSAALLIFLNTNLLSTLKEAE